MEMKVDTEEEEEAAAEAEDSAEEDEDSRFFEKSLTFFLLFSVFKRALFMRFMLF